MKEEIKPDLRITFMLPNGLRIWAKACEFGTCKNFFMIPKSEVDETPRFCPFCGIQFNPDKVTDNDDLTDRMKQVLQIVEEEDL